MDLNKITSEIQEGVRKLLLAANLEKDDILVLGCSTSEVLGEKIGSNGSLEVADAIIRGILPMLKEQNIHLAVQCCEHLNRALVVEKKVQKEYRLDPVTVIPWYHAGGSIAVKAMEYFEDPVVVEKIQAHAGIDIGQTLIGMHLRPVAVPVRLDIKKIGEANVVFARTRPKLIGGERAHYPDTAKK